jgi:hypothetical protein
MGRGHDPAFFDHIDVSIARAAVVPWVPAASRPISSTEAQTRSVRDSALGIESMSRLSPWEKPFWTRAEKPPTKSTPSSLATSSKTWAWGIVLIFRGAGDQGQRCYRDAFIDDGDTDSVSTSLPVLTRGPATFKSFSRIRQRVSTPEAQAQSNGFRYQDKQRQEVFR